MEKDMQSRDLLLNIAADLFAQRGFAAVSIRELALAAGVNSSLISYYFNGKQGLYKAALETEMEQVAVMLERLKETASEPCAYLEGYAAGLAELHSKRPALLRLINAELTNPTECFESVVRPRLGQIAGDLASVIAQGIQSGIFKENLDPLLAAMQLAGTVNFFFLFTPLTNAFLEGYNNRSQQYIKQALEVYLAGIGRN